MSRHGANQPIPSQSDLRILAQPLTLPFSGKVIKNRFCKAALSESMANKDGTLTEQMTKQYENVYSTWAKGGSGLILTGNIMVDRTMREMERNLAVENDSELESLQKIAKVVHDEGATIYGQISHPGRQSHGHLTKNPVAPSAIELPNFHPLMRFYAPTELTVDQIQDIIDRFATTAEVLEKAGFDGVELHAAHGYLISQFLNPRSNERTDDFGGSFENRARFIVEVVKAVKARTSKSFSVGVKLNSVDFGRRRRNGGEAATTAVKADTTTKELKDGANLDAEEDLAEAVKVAQLLESLEVDFIEVSGGGYEAFSSGLMDGKLLTTRTEQREAHFAVFAERISKSLNNTKIILTGGFVTSRGMIRSLQESEAGVHVDMVGLGRAVCSEPNLPNDILEGKVTGSRVLFKTPGGFMDDVFLAGGNIRRLSFNKAPIYSLGGMLMSSSHIWYVLGYAKVAGHWFKTAIGMA